MLLLTSNTAITVVLLHVKRFFFFLVVETVQPRPRNCLRSLYKQTQLS